MTCWVASIFAGTIADGQRRRGTSSHSVAVVAHPVSGNATSQRNITLPLPS
ncbi:hypothetical protein ACWDYH_31020 [Nocardia goodfellowii]